MPSERTAGIRVSCDELAHKAAIGETLLSAPQKELKSSLALWVRQTLLNPQRNGSFNRWISIKMWLTNIFYLTFSIVISVSRLTANRLPSRIGDRKGIRSQKRILHWTRFELARVSPTEIEHELKSAALDHSATNAGLTRLRSSYSIYNNSS